MKIKHKLKYKITEKRNYKIKHKVKQKRIYFN